MATTWLLTTMRSPSFSLDRTRSTSPIVTGSSRERPRATKRLVKDRQLPFAAEDASAAVRVSRLEYVNGNSVLVEERELELLEAAIGRAKPGQALRFLPHRLGDLERVRHVARVHAAGADLLLPALGRDVDERSRCGDAAAGHEHRRRRRRPHEHLGRSAHAPPLPLLPCVLARSRFGFTAPVGPIMQPVSLVGAASLGGRARRRCRLPRKARQEAAHGAPNAGH